MYRHNLNPRLIKEQGITLEGVAAIEALHDKRELIFERARAGENVICLLVELAKIEFDMQDAWGFDRNYEKHIWRYLIPRSPFPIVWGSWAAMYIGAVKLGYGWQDPHHNN